MTCDVCGAEMDFAGQSGYICKTRRCPNNWYGGKEDDPKYDDIPGARILRGEISHWTEHAAAMPVSEVKLAYLRQRHAEDISKWLFVLQTFWQKDYAEMVALLNRYPTIDEAVRAAEAERDGMVAT